MSLCEYESCPTCRLEYKNALPHACADGACCDPLEFSPEYQRDLVIQATVDKLSHAPAEPVAERNPEVAGPIRDVISTFSRWVVK